MKKIAITVGQFIHRKGFDVLLNAWAKCDKEYELRQKIKMNWQSG